MSKEKLVADEEERKVAAIAVVVSGKQRDCEEDLAKAEPALLAAQDALNTLNKVSFAGGCLPGYNSKGLPLPKGVRAHSTSLKFVWSIFE